MNQKIADLKSKLGKLGGSDREFASRLIDAFQRGRLTPNQSPWVEKLIARADGTDVVRVACANALNVGSFQTVIALFAKAKEHLKYPKITLQCDGVEIILSLCGVNS
jgi:hypothetical protein